MKLRTLGRTGARVSEMGFGGWGLGGEAYGPTEEAVSERTLREAYEVGINFYDTSDLYGAGRSETLIGRAFFGVRDRVFLATKGGTLPHTGFHMPQDFSASHLKAALHASLKRLGTGYVDLYQLHSPRLEDDQLGEALEALEQFRREGLIRWIGISARSPGDALWMAEHTSVEVLQVNFNLIDQRAADVGLMRVAVEKGIGFVARTPLCFGYLTGKFNGTENLTPGDHRSNWPQQQLQRWASAPGLFDGLIRESGLTPAQFALRFCLDHPAIGTVIPGFLTPEHVRENSAASAATSLSQEIIQEARRIYQRNTFFDPGIKKAAISRELALTPQPA